jgi:hypothetical protein
MSVKKLTTMFNEVNISFIDSIERLKKTPMNIIICGNPYWDRMSCALMELYIKKLEYNFQIYRFESVHDFDELLTDLKDDEIDKIHAFISHNHSNSERVLSKLNNRKAESNKCICLTISSIRDDSRTFEFIASVKFRLSDSIDIFVDLFMGMRENGYIQFLDTLTERWFYYIKCRNENIIPKHLTIDLHEK